MAQPLSHARRPIVAATASWFNTPLACSSSPARPLFLRTQQLCSRQFHQRSQRSFRSLTRRTTPSIRTPVSRSYHSHFHPALPTHEYTNSQATILSAALEHVPQHGFTLDALRLGARDAGFLDVSIQLLPRGEVDLVMFWLASRRGLLRAKVEGGLFEKNNTVEGQKKELSVEEKVKMLVKERLRMNESIIHKWQDALALMSYPSNVPISLSELHALSSDILNLAGDKSIDASWYTKRLSLSAIYASSEVVMTQDSSPGFRSTEAFVNRRIEDNQYIGQKVCDITQYLGFMASTAVGLGRSWGMKI
ncbi:Ubiquinone biosynthesis protein coq9, mitochondrial [Paecilomyces lecythidis]